MVSLTLYLGTLLSLQTGFTLKLVQVFSVIALIALLFNALSGGKKVFRIPVYYYLPFLLVILSASLSLINSEGIEGLRILINYLWLQLTAFVLISAIESESLLKKAINFSFLSCIITMIFGYFQQIGYYTGIYNPMDYVGIHSTFVDFYGPVLRMSPGTFANEYGEILQTNAIMITTFLILGQNVISRMEKITYSMFLFFLICSLCINLTRVSWLSYSFILILLLLISKLKFRTWVLILSTTAITITAAYMFVKLFIDTNLITLILQRFDEFNYLTEYSAGSRLELWEEAFNSFMQSPLTGNGFGSMVGTHNIFLQLLSETGIIGTTTFFTMLGFVFYRIAKAVRKAKSEYLRITGIGIFLSLLGCFIFDMTNHGINHFVFWFIIAIGLSIDLIQNERKKIN